MPTFHHRLAGPADVPGMLELLGSSACDGYGPSSGVGVAPTLARMLDEGAGRGTLLVEGARAAGRSGQTLRGVAVTGFVALARARSWLERPPLHLVDHVFERESAGDPVLLRPARVAVENAATGMALTFLAFAVGADLADPAVGKHIALMHESFRLFHEGYYCPLALHPASPSANARESLLGTGFQPVGDGSSVWSLDTTVLDRAPYHPLGVVLREFRPQLRFSPSEQSTLFRAVLGYADAEIAEELQVSVETVRKRWRNIFQRVSDRPDIPIFPTGRDAPSETKRGPEKRRALLQYLASHLEELRPHAVRDSLPARARRDE